MSGSRPADADILVNVSKSSQRMSVLVNGTARYNWKVSTGTKRYTTPSGVYKPQWLARKWRSKQYANAPMPHSIFFHNGYAVHGTTEVARLGKAASHGCVRLHPDNAAKLYELVQKHMAETRVVVSDDVIEAPGEAPKKKPSQFVAQFTAGEKPVINVPKRKPGQFASENTMVAVKPEAEKIAEPQAAAPTNTTAKAKAETATAKAPVETTTAKAPAETTTAKAPVETTIAKAPVESATAKAVPETKIAKAPAETTAVPRERKNSTRAAYRETYKPVRTAGADRSGFHW
jgi:hypothetical protein